MTFRWPWVLVMVTMAAVLGHVRERRYLVRHPEARDHLERQAWLFGVGRRPTEGAPRAL